MSKENPSNNSSELKMKEYIEWLISITKKCSSITRVDRMTISLTDLDVKNINLFPTFFMKVYEYAYKNYIDFSKEFYIKYKEYYLYASFHRFADDFYCGLYEESDFNIENRPRSYQFIDFELILKNEDLPETKNIDADFKKIKKQICEFVAKYNLGYGDINNHILKLFDAIYS